MSSGREAAARCGGADWRQRAAAAHACGPVLWVPSPPPTSLDTVIVPLSLCSYGLEAGAIVLVSALGKPAASVLQPASAGGDRGGGVLSELAEQRAIATDIAEAAAAAALDSGGQLDEQQQDHHQQQQQQQEECKERAAAAGVPPEVKAEPEDGGAAEPPKRQRVA